MAVSLIHETQHWDRGARIVVGVDEVGRGALAGPVSVGVVAVTRCTSWPQGLADSKELTVTQRERLADALAAFGLARAVGHATAREIDERGIIAGLRLAANRALATLAAADITPDAILLDGKHDWLSPPQLPRALPEQVLFDDHPEASDPGRTPPVAEPPQIRTPVTMIIKGDTLCASIAAASVLAKLERDALMREAHARYPHYGWEGNKGYGAPSHLDALRRHGPTPWHRTSWRLPEPEPQREPQSEPQPDPQPEAQTQGSVAVAPTVSVGT